MKRKSIPMLRAAGLSAAAFFTTACAALVAALIAATLPSCEHKGFCDPDPAVSRVRVTFDWRRAPGAAVTGMSLYLYPESGGEALRATAPPHRDTSTVPLPRKRWRGAALRLRQRPWRRGGDPPRHLQGAVPEQRHGERALPGHRGPRHFRGLHPAGPPARAAWPAKQPGGCQPHGRGRGAARRPPLGRQGQRGGGACRESLTQLRLRPGTDLRGKHLHRVVPADPLWAGRDNAVEVLAAKASPDSAYDQELTFFPGRETPRYTVEVRNAENLRHVSAMGFSLSGLSGSLAVASGTRDALRTTIPFEGRTDADAGTATGSFHAFGLSSSGNRLRTLVIYVILTDGSKQFYPFDVSGQVNDAPNPMEVRIVIDGLKLPHPIVEPGGGGFQPTVDDWVGETIEMEM